MSERDDTGKVRITRLFLQAMSCFNKGDYAAAYGHSEILLRYLKHESNLHRPDIIASACNWAGLSLKRWGGIAVDESLSYYREALALHRTGTYLNNLGVALYELGDYEGASSHIREAISSSGLDETEAHSHRVNLAVVLAAQGEFGRAMPLFRDAIARFTEARNEPELAHAHHRLGDCLGKLGHFDEAFLLLRRALEVKQRLWGSVHPCVGEVFESIARVHLDAGDLLSASQSCTTALQCYEPQLHTTSAELARISLLQASVADQMGSLAAKQYYDNAGNAFLLAYGRHMNRHPDHARLLHLRGQFYARRGRHLEALSHFAEAEQVYRHLPGHRNLSYFAELMNDRGFCYGALGDFKQEWKCLAISRKLLNKINRRHPWTIALYKNLRSALVHRGHHRLAQLYTTVTPRDRDVPSCSLSANTHEPKKSSSIHFLLAASHDLAYLSTNICEKLEEATRYYRHDDISLTHTSCHTLEDLVQSLQDYQGSTRVFVGLNGHTSEPLVITEELAARFPWILDHRHRSLFDIMATYGMRHSDATLIYCTGVLNATVDRFTRDARTCTHTVVFKLLTPYGCSVNAIWPDLNTLIDNCVSRSNDHVQSHPKQEPEHEHTA